MHDKIRKFQKKVPIDESISDGKRSDNSELKVSVRSSQNYFMDFEKEKKQKNLTLAYREKREKKKKEDEEQ